VTLVYDVETISDTFVNHNMWGIVYPKFMQQVFRIVFLQFFRSKKYVIFSKDACDTAHLQVIIVSFRRLFEVKINF
jgi:hypothetical protein